MPKRNKGDPPKSEPKAAPRNKTKLLTAKERREKDRIRQERHRKRRKEQELKILNFTVSRETARDIETLKNYAAKQGIPFNYSTYFSAVIAVAAEKIRYSTRMTDNFNVLATFVVNETTQMTQRKVYRYEEVLEYFVETYSLLHSYYPEEFPAKRLDEVRQRAFEAHRVYDLERGWRLAAPDIHGVVQRDDSEIYDEAYEGLDQLDLYDHYPNYGDESFAECDDPSERD
jgi:hypothetical protein